jgi:hypothetical protein
MIMEATKPAHFVMSMIWMDSEKLLYFIHEMSRNFIMHNAQSFTLPVVHLAVIQVTLPLPHLARKTVVVMYL